MIELKNFNNEFIEVKESNVHGKGLFAKKDIPAETFICKIEGDFIDEDECVRREEFENNNYIFWYDDSNYIDVSKNFMRYLNHHCDPKCYVDDHDDENSLSLVSAVDIKTGDEITIDYEYDEIYSYCNCSLCQEEKKAVG